LQLESSQIQLPIITNKNADNSERNKSSEEQYSESDGAPRLIVGQMAGEADRAVA
jgi:hypothetical protein